jgi:hypothetical protein
MTKTTLSIAVAAAALVVAGSAGAQVCAGFPTTDGQGTIGGLVNFPTGFDQYGAEGSYNLAGPLAVNAGYLYNKGDDDHTSTFRGGAAFELPAFAGRLRSTASLCPSVRADYTSQDDATSWQVPIGVGVGASVPVGGPETRVTLYVIPALVWTRVHFDAQPIDVFEHTITDTDLGVRAGAELNFNRLYLGVTSEWVDRGDQEAVVGVRAGIRL